MKKGSLKPLMILVILLLLACGSGALADETFVVGGTSLDDAKLIYCGIPYKSTGTTQENATFTSYYQFVAPADDVCTISYEVEKRYWKSNGRDKTTWLLVAYDGERNRIRFEEKVYTFTSESFEQKVFPCIIATTSFPVKKGETYTFLLANGYPYYNDWYRYYEEAGLKTFKDPVGNYRFSVCLKGTHATTAPYDYTMEKEPTCTENGIETAVCEWCGETLDRRIVPALGHIAGEWRTDRVATCSEEGFSAVRCKVCNEILEKETLEKLPHVQGKTVVIVNPTCEDPGFEKAVCEICGETVSERAIDPLGHTAGEWIVQTEASCDREGDEVQICGTCHAVVHSRAIQKTPHTPSEWMVYSAAYCTADGSEVQKCEVCGEITNKRAVPATGHIPGSYATLREASCTMDGERLLVCTVCGATMGQETVPAAGHQFTDWVTELPTDDHDGRASRFCLACGETEIKVLKKSN